MRALLCVLGVLVALAATPAAAQQSLTPQQLATAERFVGPPVDQAINLCVSDIIPDIPALERRWVEAGWPAFGSEGDSRISHIPPGDRQLLSVALSNAPVADAVSPSVTLTCTLLTPTPFESVMNARLEARFGAVNGVFHLEGGSLVELDLEVVSSSLSQLLEEAAAEQRVVILRTGREGSLSFARISILHRDR